ncbi:hypothetical protein [uncultured Lacinutrix sp.]|uniref:hypothetical protein n=1 Tax=uncultured Lacinutrix sp. TaxID=574032 RepID=UPI0026382A51|nr:hypothetical protein [uncultured Lacinutrix sp.]
MLLKAAYILLTIIIILIIINIGFKTINKTFSEKVVVKKKKVTLVTGLLLWQLYVFIVASSGVLETYDLPPRFPIFLILPAFLFTAIFIYKNRNNAWIQNINPKALIYIQTFRVLVETIFVFSLSAGILHKNVTIEGYNMDMIFAFTAPIVAYLAFNKLSKKFVVYWNYLGLLVLASVIFVFVSSIYIPEIYSANIPLIPMEAVKYPYLLVAAFLMPFAVFIHVLSIVQLTRKTI